MSEPKVGGFRTAIDMTQQIVTDLQASATLAERLISQHEQLRTRAEWLERELAKLREEHERLRSQHGEISRALTDLQVKHQDLLRDHGESLDALRELNQRYEALLEDRRRAAALEVLLRRLRP